ncbi:1,4-alpha-glucan branching protein [Streptomyces sp. DH12]|uniref:maltokinase N-terminal cap-like domain-containing protein n=1 Tax=Streptomyces sp. DH12 TaxID=2857010 RepID=UPI001E5AC4EC|nr:1,4-alpha-glucan branching protein [Streptomyces sp. DH12]
MAIIHRTTMEPTKLELLAAWLPAQPWYQGTGGKPLLDRVGGWRLDDPEGAVGIEFMVVVDASGDAPRSYHVPLTYRGAPLAGAEHALVGTTEHGVLGTRWVYDGAHDPVLVAAVRALLRGDAEPQAQSESDTPDPTVGARLAAGADPDGAVLDVVRVPGREGGAGVLGEVTAPWSRADGESSRAPFFVLRGHSPRPA